jgi:hypothetical protein
MKVFFTASYFGKEKYQSQYDLVRKNLEKSGIELLSPEGRLCESLWVVS